MSKVHSKEELLEIAKPLFNQFGVKVMYGVSDGQIFLSSIRAQAHAGDKTVHKLEAEVEAEGEPKTEVVSPSVKVIAEQIKTIEDTTVLQEMLLSEIGGLNRKSAVEAIEKRMATIVANSTNTEKQ